MNRSKSFKCNKIRPEYKTECGTVLTSVEAEVRRTGQTAKFGRSGLDSERKVVELGLEKSL
jgi:hypothetical protein